MMKAVLYFTSQIHSHYKANKNLSSPELLSRLREESAFPYGKATLLALLKANGFR